MISKEHVNRMEAYFFSNKMKAIPDRTGKNVKIAVIDSGVNAYHSHVNGVSGGIQLRVNRQMVIEAHDDFRDRLGHGTAVTAVIRSLASDSEIYAIKIFDEKLATYPSVLVEAIEWAIDEDFDIINLSLGLPEDNEGLQTVCKKANDKGIAIVAAIDESQGLVYPATYDYVFGVRAGDAKRDEWMFYKDSLFYASGLPRKLDGPIQFYNMHGHSFAAAHFSAHLALLLEDNPSWSSKNVWDYFIELREIVGGGNN